MTHAFIVFPLFYERLSLLLPKSNSSTQPPALEFIFWLGRVPGPQVIHFTLYFVCSLQHTNMFFKKKKKKSSAPLSPSSCCCTSLFFCSQTSQRAIYISRFPSSLAVYCSNVSNLLSVPDTAIKLFLPINFILLNPVYIFLFLYLTMLTISSFLTLLFISLS